MLSNSSIKSTPSDMRSLRSNRKKSCRHTSKRGLLREFNGRHTPEGTHLAYRRLEPVPFQVLGGGAHDVSVLITHQFAQRLCLRVAHHNQNQQVRSETTEGLQVIALRLPQFYANSLLVSANKRHARHDQLPFPLRCIRPSQCTPYRPTSDFL
jgi:hypothetical protein